MEKLLWETKFQNNFDDEYDFLETILRSYDIQDVKSFLHPVKNKVINNPFQMKNMDKAVQVFHDNIGTDKKIVIKVDPDTDGATSAVLTSKIISHFNPEAKIEYIFSFNKEHGLTYKDLSDYPKDDVGLIIIPDASMLCKDAIQIAKNYNCPIIVLDHHLVEIEYLDTNTGKWISKNEADEIKEEESDRIKEDSYVNYCVAVNDTDGNYPNPTLSGVGVVRKFGEAYCEKYHCNDSWLDEYLDLVSLGIIADSMDLRDLETRWYVLEGLKIENQKNDFLNELQERMADEIHFGRTITNVGWVLAPRINGVVRYGTEKEQRDLFRAMVGEQETVIYQPRRKRATDPKPLPEEHTLQWEMARVANNVKARQDTAVRKFMEQIIDKIDKQGLDKNTILFVDCTDIVDKKSVTGLVANKIASKYLRPVVLLKERSASEFGGSCRGYDKGNIKNLKEFLEQTGLISCAGHENAAGVFLKKKNVDEVIKKCNEMLPLDQLKTIYPVDWEIPANEMQVRFVKEVAENYEVWGNTVPTPTFAITNLHINASQINGYGETKSFIRFQHNGITYIKKYCPATEFDMMTLKDRHTFGANKKNLVMNLICQFQLESWEDKIYPEVKILYYDVMEDKTNETPDLKSKTKSDAILNSKTTSLNAKSTTDFDWGEIEKPKKRRVMLDKDLEDLDF